MNQPLTTINPVAPLPPAPRRYGSMNWIGLRMLIWREVGRFLKVWVQTVAAPVMTTLLFMAVFTLAMGGRTSGMAGVPYGQFLAPGLMMMGIVSNSFQNTSSSILIAKVQGITGDFLTPPFSAGELTLAFLIGAVTRGLLVGAASAAAAATMTNIMPMHWWAAFYFPFTAALVFAAIGLIGGMWALKIDGLAAVTNFIITPLTFLSGTFYSVDRLPEPFRTLSHYNPVHYMIDGFRYAFIGKADLDIGMSALICGAMALGLSLLCWRLLQLGWKLKS